jgi:hypothetical protein
MMPGRPPTTGRSFVRPFLRHVARAFGFGRPADDPFNLWFAQRVVPVSKQDDWTPGYRLYSDYLAFVTPADGRIAHAMSHRAFTARIGDRLRTRARLIRRTGAGGGFVNLRCWPLALVAAEGGQG